MAQENSETKTLAAQTEALKARVLQLNRDLFLLQEDLLHPASTRLALYVSMDMGQLFDLESVRVKLDGEPVTSFLYTPRDVEALKRGAIQPLYMGNIASGEHELVALFTGKGPHSRPYKRAVNLKFTKEATEKAFEIKILDNETSQQPDFVIKPWQ
jgi:hypothetical protein